MDLSQRVDNYLREKGNKYGPIRSGISFNSLRVCSVNNWILYFCTYMYLDKSTKHIYCSPFTATADRCRGGGGEEETRQNWSKIEHTLVVFSSVFNDNYVLFGVR